MGPDLVEASGPIMLSVDQALETLLIHIQPLAEEKIALFNSLGQIAAEDVRASINVPEWDSASRDGYAVKSGSIKGACPGHPCVLKVIDTAAAGSIAQHSVTAGTAIRIMTGAQIPAGADCVVRFEDTDEETRGLETSAIGFKEIGILIEAQALTNIRPAGESIAKDTLVLAKGRRIGPGELGLLSSLGLSQVKVIRRPVVAIIATGDELVNPGKPLSSPGIYNSNSFTIAALVKSAGCLPKILGIARDNRASLIAKMRRAMKADAIITCGGSSVGDFDLVKKIVSQLGRIVFRKVNMSPGQPFSFGLIKDARTQKTGRTLPHFILTGNPSAAMVNFEVLVRPALLKMQGRTDLFPPLIEATLKGPFENKKQSRCFLWAVLNKQEDAFFADISPTPGQAVFPLIAAANGLVIVPESKNSLQPQDKVQAIPLDWSFARWHL